MLKLNDVALNWVADVRKQIAAAFKSLYKYFTSSSTVIIENSTFKVIIKLSHHWETPVQMVCLYNTSNSSFSVLFRLLFSRWKKKYIYIYIYIYIPYWAVSLRDSAQYGIYFLPTSRQYYTTIPRRGGEWWWIYTETRGVEVYIHRSSPTLRGIVVLVFTKSDG